jgi:hypothetical protein
MSLYPKVSKWLMPHDLLSASLAEMCIDGAKGNEGICLWLGIRDEDRETATISHLVKLRGPGIRKSPANIQIDPELMREVHHAAQALDRILVGQIHSHGREYGIDLSYVDIKYGISVPYYLSIVAPDYAMTPDTFWADCGTHIYLLAAGYVRVDPAGILSESSIPLSILTISND